MKFITAQEYCEKIFDGTHASPDYYETGFPLVTSKHLKPFGLDLGSTKKISKADFDSINKRSQVSQWDILFSMIGTVGRLYWEKQSNIAYAVKNIGVFSCQNRAKAECLYYYLQSPIAKRHIDTMLNGAVQQFMSLSALRNFPVPENLIEYYPQVQVLSSIDQKIELNNQINDYLMDFLRQLYKGWFVDYIPFGGERPANWEKGTLKDILALKKNTIRQGERSELPYLPIDVMPMNSFALSELRPNSEAQSSLITFNTNDILIGAMRVYFHRVLPAPLEGITRSTCFVLSPKSKLHFAYGLLTCDLDTCIDFADSRSKGSTMPYAVWEGGMGDFSIDLPTEDILIKFDEIARPLIDRLQQSYFENKTLSELRDFLLPKLLSGEIDLS